MTNARAPSLTAKEMTSEKMRFLVSDSYSNSSGRGLLFRVIWLPSNYEIYYSYDTSSS
jgi:hypothetical protein